jgi:hypothetical protein
VEGKLIRYEIRKTACVLNTKTLFGMNWVVEQDIETKVLMETCDLGDYM